VFSTGEVKIIDYQTQQHRIIPHVAQTFAYYLAGRKLYETYGRITAMISRGDATLLPQVPENFLLIGLYMKCYMYLDGLIYQTEL